jgi:hypothetical protein
MIKMPLDEYDILEIAIGARLPVGLIEVAHALWVSDDYPSLFER